MNRETELQLLKNEIFVLQTQLNKLEDQIHKLNSNDIDKMIQLLRRLGSVVYGLNNRLDEV